MDDISENAVVKKAANVSENVGDKLMDMGENVYEKVTDKGNEFGEKLASTGDDLLGKTKGMSEVVGDKLSDAKDNIVEKAKDIAGKLDEKLDETIKKAEDLAAFEKANPTPEISETNFNAGGSLLEGTDDFFANAEKYADGNHEAFSEGKITIHKEVSDTGKVVELSKIAGMDDLDGDGNELIDDALIEKSNEEE